MVVYRKMMSYFHIEDLWPPRLSDYEKQQKKPCIATNYTS